MSDTIIMGETLMLIGANDPMRAEELFRQANGEVKETKENGVRYIIIKDKTETNDRETN
jgi:hypothetical protein